MSLRRNGPLDRRLEIPTATKFESFPPTMKSVSTDRKGLRLVPQFGRFLLSVRASYFSWQKDQRQRWKILMGLVWGASGLYAKTWASPQADFSWKQETRSNYHTHTNFCVAKSWRQYRKPRRKMQTVRRAMSLRTTLRSARGHTMTLRPVCPAGGESSQRTAILSRDVISSAQPLQLHKHFARG